MNGLSEHLFWDVQRDAVDPEHHAAWLVKRVIEYGYWTDWQALVAYYGKARLSRIVVEIRALTPRALAFLPRLVPTRQRRFPMLQYSAISLAVREVLEEFGPLSKTPSAKRLRAWIEVTRSTMPLLRNAFLTARDFALMKRPPLPHS